MAIAEHASGSQTATLDTEHTLNGTSPETTDGIFQIVLDLVNMVRADVTYLRVYEKCRAGDTAQLVAEWCFQNEQTEKLFMSPALILLHGWDVKLEQTDGTGRVYGWSIRKIT
jgi:hypothetical protein